MEDYWATDYWHSMDRSKGKDIININPSQIGISHGIGDPLQGLKGNIFVGASKVELGFMGQGKGFRSQPTGWTPESVSMPEREAIRQLAKINEVELSTHATPNVAISGITEQGFSEEQRERALFEVKKAIDFAADTARGGPVVLHAQEFPRSIAETYKKEKFIQYPEEEKKAVLSLVDSETGRLTSLRRDIKIPEIIKDESGNPIRDENNKLRTEMKQFSSYEDEFKKLSQEEKNKYDNSIAKYFYAKFRISEKERLEADAEFYDERVRNAEKREKELKSLQETVKLSKNKEYVIDLLPEKFKEGLSHEERIKLLKNPDEFFNSVLKDLNTEKRRFQEGSEGYSKQAFQIEHEINKIKPIEEYGIEKSAEAIARAALHGYDIEKKEKLERPITIVPENWTPEVYGSHPAELKKLIQESRKAMTGLLMKDKHLTQNEAEKIAQERIKATFDIGHLNMWRKYFQGSDKEFKQWVDEQVQDLLRNKIIGHVHLTDNFGYHDEHLTPGEGTAPIREFLQRLETEGYTGTIIGEPGGQPEGKIFQAMTGSWGLSNYPMYRLDGLARSWSDIEHSYFGQVEGPRFIVGETAPSKEWSLWSEVPLE